MCRCKCVWKTARRHRSMTPLLLVCIPWLKGAYSTFCMRFLSDITVNITRKLASKWFIPANICNCVNTSCAWATAASEFIFATFSFFFFFSFCSHSVGGAFQHFGGHTSRSGKRQSDEHITLRTSPLTRPIYFDNQLTIVPVQPLKGQWFIRIDQFWVTSCAALWGQTEAWLAVQSGMLSNAQAWLTAHQHAELNSLAKCFFPFYPDITHSYKTMNLSTLKHILCIHMKWTFSFLTQKINK